MTPTSGTVGSTVTLSISSTAFPIDGPYKIRWSSTTAFEDDKTVVIKEGEVPRNGYSLTESVQIPEAKYGTHFIQFWRYSRDDYANFQFSVRPKLEVIPPQAYPGAVVKIKGTGFPVDGDSAVTFDGKATDIKVATGANGTFIVDFTIPSTIAGDHKFVANAPKVITDVMAAMVKVVPTITMEPRQPEIGAEVKISGTGFAASSVIKLKYDNVSIANSPTTKEDGSFAYVFKVPDSSAKDHRVTAEDGAGNSAAWSLALETQAPPKPAPQSPKNERFGWLGDQSVTFTWSAVTDISGVTYSVEVGEDLTFFPLKPGMKKVGLTQTDCTLTIKPGSYYWRVKAIDGAGNEGEWAISPYPFSVGFFSTWMLVAGGLVCLIIFIFLIRAFFRRLRDYY